MTTLNDQEFLLVLDKFRDEPATGIAFQPSIERLLDGRLCESLTKLISEEGSFWEKRLATAGLDSQLPDDKGLYMFVWKPELTLKFANGNRHQWCWVLYVGKAGTEGGVNDTIRQRYKTEYSRYVQGDPSFLFRDAAPSTREERLKTFLALRPLEFWYLHLKDTRNIAVYERKLIRFLGPPVNSHHGPRIRPGKTVPAFEEPKT